MESQIESGLVLTPYVTRLSGRDDSKRKLSQYCVGGRGQIETHVWRWFYFSLSLSPIEDILWSEILLKEMIITVLQCVIEKETITEFFFNPLLLH